MKQILTGMFIFFCIPISFAGSNLRLPDTRSLGMGGNEVTQSPLSNPSLIALSTIRQIGLQYISLYGIKELSSGNIALKYPNPTLPFAVDVSAFGYDEYRESLFRLSLGKRVFSRWSVGLSIQYSLLQTELYEKQASGLSADIGLTFQPVDKLLIGLLISGLPSVRLDDKIIDIDDFNYYFIQTGLEWYIINNMLIAASVGYDSEKNISPCIGIEYSPYEQFSIRAGMKGNPFLPSAGVGYKYANFTMNTSILYHSVLGVSPDVGLIFSF